MRFTPARLGIQKWLEREFMLIRVKTYLWNAGISVVSCTYPER